MNISLKSLADAIGIDKGGLSKLERGEQGYSRDTIESIAKIFGVSIGTLFNEPEVVESAALRMRPLPVLTLKELTVWRGPDSANLPDEFELLYGSLDRLSRYAFALRVPVPSPWPAYSPGEDLIFDAKVRPGRGRVVVAQDQNGKTYIGRLRILEEPGSFEIWPADAIDPVATTKANLGLTIRGVLVEERRYPS